MSAVASTVPGGAIGLLRPHQWVKNALLLLPIGAVGGASPADLPYAALLLALAAFCLFASAGYVINDLRDADEDARHPTKRLRPIASGRVSRPGAWSIALALTVAGVAAAMAVNARFLLVACVYLVANLAYTLWLKRVHLADVMFLASLYTLRIIAGCAVIGVAPSIWLLSLSMFMFFSLALAKRYRELSVSVAADGRLHSRRDYTVEDRDLVRSLGLASGTVAALVVALYIESATAHRIYQSPAWLWLACPVLWFWITRIWSKCVRDQIADDPVLFAVRDRTSWVALGLLGALWACATAGLPSPFGP